MDTRPDKINLMVTKKCNQACPYCFAAEAMRNAEDEGSMTFAECAHCIDFLVESGGTTVSLLGGEPTLHPDFERIVDYALTNGVNTCVFSNLLFSQGFQCLHAVDIVANINSLDFYSAGQLANIRRNLDSYADRIMLGFNIYTLDKSYLGVLDLVNEHCLAKRQLRVGIASPTPDQTNRFVPVEDFSKVGEYVVELSRECSKRGIQIRYDCGFVRCMFHEKEIDELEELGATAKFRCGTPVDVGPGLRAWHCFPLSSYPSVDVMRFSTVGHLRRVLAQMYGSYRAFGARKGCPTCQHKKRGLCHGGCLGHVLALAARTPFASTEPDLLQV